MKKLALWLLMAFILFVFGYAQTEIKADLSRTFQLLEILSMKVMTTKNHWI